MKYINLTTRTEFLIDRDCCSDVVDLQNQLIAENITIANANAKLPEGTEPAPLLNVQHVLDAFMAENYPHILAVVDNHVFFMAMSENSYMDWSTGAPVLTLYTPEQLTAKQAANALSVASVVSPRQIRQALTAAGLRAAVEAAVASGSQDLKDWWEFATIFERQHPMVIGMASGLGVSESQLDDLFLLAHSL